MKAPVQFAGWRFDIVEFAPIKKRGFDWNGSDYRVLDWRDTLEGAEEVFWALQNTGVNFECYGIMLRPVWRGTAP